MCPRSRSTSPDNSSYDNYVLYTYYNTKSHKFHPSEAGRPLPPKDEKLPLLLYYAILAHEYKGEDARYG